MKHLLLQTTRPLSRLAYAWRCGVAGALLSASCASVASAQAVNFGPPTLFQIPGLPRPGKVLIADINGDGKNDILTANRNTNTIGALLNRGSGQFVSGYNFAAGGTPAGMATADVNGDGKIDILTTVDGLSVAVLLGTNGGNFQAPVLYSAGASNFLGANSLALADMNGDGQLDAVTTNSNNHSVSVLPGTGAGTFGTAATFSTGVSSPYGFATEPGALALMDVNGDGRTDIVAADTKFYSVSVLLASSTGTGFQPAIVYSVGIGSYPYGLQVADVNGDNRPDILTANYNSDKVGVLLNAGAGIFQPPVQYSLGPVNSAAQDLAVADVNGDTKLDLITANNGSNSAGVLLGNGNGTFQPVVVVRASNFATGATISPNAVAVGDLTGDGKPDLALTDDGFNVVSVVPNNSTYLATQSPLLAGAAIFMAPNPAAEATTLHLTLPVGITQVNAEILTMVGQTVGHVAIPVKQRTLQHTLTTASLPAGLYLVVLTAYGAAGQQLGKLPMQRLCIR